MLALGLLTLASLPLAGQLPQAYLFLLGPLKVSLASYQSAGLALSLLFLLPSTLLQGFCFPLFSHLRPAGALPAQAATGELYAWNTVGAMIGALLTGFWMIGSLGLQASYSLLAWIPLGLGVALSCRARGTDWLRQAALQAGVLALCLGLACFFRPWNEQLMSTAPYLLALHPENGPQAGESLAAHQARVAVPLYYRDGKEALVGVKASGTDHILTVNGKPDASNGWDFSTQKALAHVTLLLHPHPKTALVIGWGAGSSAGSAGLHPLERLDCVEIEPAVFEARRFFTEVNFSVAEDPRFHIHFGDGRNFLLESPRRYDAIISQPTNPWVQGVANLFTLDFYTTVSAHLEKGGIFGQWFQYYNMSLQDLKTLLRTFNLAFSHTSLWAMPDRSGSKQLAGDLLLLGSQEALPLDAAAIKRKIEGASSGLREDLERSWLNGTYPVLSHYWLGREELLQVAGEGPVFRDDLPALEFSAAKNLYLSPQAAQDQMWGNFSALKAAVRDLVPPVQAWPPLAPGAPKKARAEALRQLAAGYIPAHLYERAQSLLQESLLLDAGSAETWMLFAKINYARPGHEGAREAALKAVGLDPGRGDAWMLLGSLDYEAEDWKGGRDAYVRATKLKPRDAQAWSGLALCLARLDDWGHASIAVKQSLVIDPNDPMAQALWAKVRNVTGKN
jgi:spermidine synthase